MDSISVLDEALAEYDRAVVSAQNAHDCALQLGQDFIYTKTIFEAAINAARAEFKSKVSYFGV